MNEVIPFLFEGRSVRVITDETGEKLFVAKDVAELLGYKNSNDAINKHCKGVAIRYPLQTAGGIQNIRGIKLPDVFRLTTNSQLPEAQKIEKWVYEDIMPSVMTTGSYEIPGLNQSSVSESQFGMVMKSCESMIRTLKPSRGGQLIMYEQACQQFGLPTSHIPDYSTNERVAASLTALIKEQGIKLSAKKANISLVKLGILEQHERPSSKHADVMRTFYAISEKGLRFGRNDITPKCPNQTQPHWYKDTFPELVDMIMQPESSTAH